jgi:hypothetical protein
MRLVLVLTLLLLVAGPAPASGQGAPGIAVPPGVEDKIGWADTQLRLIDTEVAPELAKPQAQWSRAYLERLVARATALRDVGNTLRYNASRPPLGAQGMTDADRALRTLDDALDEAKREADIAKRQADAENRRADEARRAHQEAAATESRRLAAIKSGGYPAADVKRIADRKVWIGMSKEQALLSWGPPSRRHERITASGKTEVWSYGPSTLTLDNGRVVAIDQSR